MNYFNQVILNNLYCKFFFQGVCGSFGTRYFTMLDHVTTFTNYRLILEASDSFGHSAIPQEVTVTMNVFGWFFNLSKAHGCAFQINRRIKLQHDKSIKGKTMKFS